MVSEKVKNASHAEAAKQRKRFESGNFLRFPRRKASRNAPTPALFESIAVGLIGYLEDAILRRA